MGAQEDLNKNPPQIINRPTKFKIQEDPYYPYFPKKTVKRRRADSERAHNWAPCGFLALSIAENLRKETGKLPDLNLPPPAKVFKEFYQNSKRENSEGEQRKGDSHIWARARGQIGLSF